MKEMLALKAKLIPSAIHFAELFEIVQTVIAPAYSITELVEGFSLSVVSLRVVTPFRGTLRFFRGSLPDVSV